MPPTYVTRPLACLLVMPMFLTGPSSATPAMEAPVEGDMSRPCFIELPRWNVTLDNPLPRC